MGKIQLMDRIKMFDGYLNFNFREYYENAIHLLGLVPDYFFTIPASSTGKHHPQYCLGEGGLVRHTKAAMKIGDILIDKDGASELYEDVVKFSLLFHDCIKKGIPEQDHTAFEHPLLAAEFVRSSIIGDVVEKHWIADAIASHMGRWSLKDGVQLPEPACYIEEVVHTADYLASRKVIDVKL